VKSSERGKTQTEKGKKGWGVPARELKGAQKNVAKGRWKLTQPVYEGNKISVCEDRGRKAKKKASSLLRNEKNDWTYTTMAER